MTQEQLQNRIKELLIKIPVDDWKFVAEQGKLDRFEANVSDFIFQIWQGNSGSAPSLIVNKIYINVNVSDLFIKLSVIKKENDTVNHGIFLESIITKLEAI